MASCDTSISEREEKEIDVSILWRKTFHKALYFISQYITRELHLMKLYFFYEKWKIVRNIVACSPAAISSDI